jgi:ABC-type Fe3+-hydroxamate transport system substrate-binding protein
MSLFADAAGTAHPPALDTPRIVSLVPSITELVCALGLADQLVGRTGFCIHPRDTVKRIPKLGGTKDVKLDKLRALAPTHVIVNVDENRKEIVDELARLGCRVIVTHPLAPRDNVALYRLIGGIFGREREARELSNRFERAYVEATATGTQFEPQRVLYLIWREPWMTVSRDTYVSRMLALVGWHTMPEAAAERYPTIALDEPTLATIDVVLLSTEPYMFRERHVAEVQAMPAVRGKTVALIDAEMTSWYGSRAIDGLAYLPRFRRALAGAR